MTPESSPDNDQWKHHSPGSATNDQVNTTTFSPGLNNCGGGAASSASAVSSPPGAQAVGVPPPKYNGHVVNSVSEALTNQNVRQSDPVHGMVRFTQHEHMTTPIF